MSYFDIAVNDLLGMIDVADDGAEGGYVNDPRDPGGETKFGISKANHPDVDIKSLTERQARDIYKVEYWDRFHLDDIDDAAVASKTFSLVVNDGLFGVKCLQRACRACGHYVKDDGVIGSATANAVRLSDKQSLLAALKSEGAGYYRSVVVRKPEMKWALEGWLARAYR